MAATTLEENKALIHHMTEEFNKRNMVDLENYFVADLVDHYHHTNNLEQYRQFVENLLKILPDFHETIEDVIAEGDKVWYRFRATATLTGEGKILGITITPTGGKITATGVIMCRMVNGKIAELWEITSEMSLYEELGLIEMTEKGKKLSTGRTP